MVTETGHGTTMLRKSGIFRPLPILLLVGALLLALLAVPLRVPIGAMYWDLLIYFDAANRILDGQTPSTDFFAPVGPLGYYLFTAGVKLFPDAQPLLLVHWSLLAVTGPLMALILWNIEKQARLTAIALLVPFLVFAVLPFNTREFWPYPGSDGFGIYNRQVCQLLYVLVAGLVFQRDQRALAVTIIAAMSALFLTKITGFVSGGLLCAFAFAAGRVSWRTALACLSGFLAIVAVLEVLSGFTLNYLADILALVALNEDSLAPRFLQAASLTFGVVAPAGILVLLLLFSERRSIASDLRALANERSVPAIAKLLDRHALWIGIVLVAGIFFETQNTGSQALIFLWPALLAMLIDPRIRSMGLTRLGAAAFLAAAAALPPIVNTTERAARTYIGSIKNVPLPSRNLKTLGQVNMRPEILARAEKMLDFYVRHRETYADFINIKELPAYMYYSEFDFQAGLLMSMDRAADSIRALEDKNGIRFETILTLNFVNPMPWIMDRRAPLHVAIGADPTRAVPEPGPEALQAVRNTDLILHPTCPLTTANADLLEIYGPAMKDHRKITLNACYDAYIRPGLSEKL